MDDQGHRWLLAFSFFTLMNVVNTTPGADWEQWSAWSECSRTCDSGVRGVQGRSRTCTQIVGGVECVGDSDQSRFCNLQPCPQDGAWTEWESWTDCSASCGVGAHQRQRECEGQVGGGLPCVGDDQEVASCTSRPCQIGGEWGLWGVWGNCSATCGGGTRQRGRICEPPSPMHTGQTCVGEEHEWEGCNQHYCPGNQVVDGSWGPWTLLTACNVTCGPGTMSRMRTCSNPLPANGGANCTGIDEEFVDCNPGECPIDGGWGPWSNFSECSVTCGGGVMRQIRDCDSPRPMYGGALCNITSPMDNVTDTPGRVGFQQAYTLHCNPEACQAINGSWAEWRPMYQCSVTCNTGVRKWIRICCSPPPQNGGLDCELSGTENSTEDGLTVEYKTIPCVTGFTCPIHGGWSAWGMWSSCPVTCGQGQQTRMRTCTNPAPDHNGENCEGDANDVQDCLIPACNVPGGWGAWGSWLPCSQSCEGGNTSRSRSCDSPPQSGTGLPCSGSSVETGECNTQSCPSIDGVWSVWGEWGQCSKSCGEYGVRARLRSCNNPKPRRGGAPCPGEDLSTEPCEEHHCSEMVIINGHWGHWSSWSVCSLSCGGGTRVRTRFCNNPLPSDLGRACPQETFSKHWTPPIFLVKAKDVEKCNMHACPVDGALSGWTGWTSCTAACGGGVRRRFRYCDSPAPKNYGLPCPKMSSYSKIQAETLACNTQMCLSASLSSTTPAVSTEAKPSCPETKAHDELKWPQTEVGQRAKLICPLGSSGFAFRLCKDADTWDVSDTSGCQTENFENVYYLAYYSSKHLANKTALQSAVNGFTITCKPEQIKGRVQLEKCIEAYGVLANRGIPEDPVLSVDERDRMYKQILHTASQMTDKQLASQWRSIGYVESRDDVSALADLANVTLGMVTSMARHRKKLKGESLVFTTNYIDTSVEKITCETMSYRYPPKPPPATPPNKHVRGGWEPPPEVEMTHVAIPLSFLRESICDEEKKAREDQGSSSKTILIRNGEVVTKRRKKRQTLNDLLGINRPEEVITMEPKYPAAVLYKSLHHLLPDENRKPYVAPPKDPNTGYIPVEDMRVVNAFVISITLVTGKGGSNQTIPYSIRFAHIKEGRSPQCASLEINNKRKLYDVSACNMTETTTEYTQCECRRSAATYVLLMKPGIPRDNVTHEVKQDIFLTYGCYIGIVVHTLAIFALLFIGLWSVDKHWVVIMFCIATVIYQLFTIVGVRWVNNDHICYFISWLLHYSTIVCISWVMAICALQYKVLENPQPLGLKWRLIYCAVCWLIPAFIAIMPTALRYGYVTRVYFCWLSNDESTLFGFLIPLLFIALMAVAALIFAYRTNCPDLKLDRIDDGPDYYARRRLIRVLFAFIAFVFLTLLTYGLNIGVAFLICNLAQCLFVALIFVLLNDDVHRGYGLKRQTLEEFIRIKREQEGPQLEEEIQEDEPEWVRQTGTMAIGPPPKTLHRLEPISETTTAEERKAARRERRRRKRMAMHKPVYLASSDTAQPAPLAPLPVPPPIVSSRASQAPPPRPMETPSGESRVGGNAPPSARPGTKLSRRERRDRLRQKAALGQ